MLRGAFQNGVAGHWRLNSRPLIRWSVKGNHAESSGSWLLKLDHDGESQAGLVFPKIRKPGADRPAECRICNGAVVVADEQTGRTGVSTPEHSGASGVSARRRNAARAGEIRYTGVAVSVLHPKSNVLPGHPIECG